MDKIELPPASGRTGIGGARIPLADWDRAPWNRWTFQHVREVLPTVPVRRGDGGTTTLARDLQDFGPLAFEAEGTRQTVQSALEESFTDGFLVLHRGRIVTEIYANGMEPHTLHLAQSVSKSITGATCGALIGRGLIDPDAPIVSYLPELGATAYRDASLRHVLDMTSGVTFVEDYTAARSHMAQLDVASGWKAAPEPGWPDSVWALILGLNEKQSEHGRAFGYRSIETDVLAFVMQRATSKSLAELVSREIWSQIGAEEDACFSVDPAGYGLADGGFNACLRDFGRFALLLLNDGVNGRGKRILSSAWIDETRSGDRSRFGEPYTAILPQGAYRNQFWIEDDTRRAFMARGVFGQLIYIDPQAEFAAVKLSSWPDFQNPARMRTTLAAIRCIRDNLR